MHFHIPNLNYLGLLRQGCLIKVIFYEVETEAQSGLATWASALAGSDGTEKAHFSAPVPHPSLVGNPGWGPELEFSL